MNPIYRCVRCGENKDDNKSRYAFDKDLKGKVCFECKQKEHEVRKEIDKAKNRFNKLLIDVFINNKQNLQNYPKTINTIKDLYNSDKIKAKEILNLNL